MWRLVGPGGVLAITTWGPGLFEPANSVFWDSVRAVEPSLFKAFNPWDEITTAKALRDLYSRAGIADATAVAVPGRHHLDGPDRFWDIVLGSGYRATVDALSGGQREQVRERVIGGLRARKIATLHRRPATLADQSTAARCICSSEVNSRPRKTSPGSMAWATRPSAYPAACGPGPGRSARRNGRRARHTSG
jgi:hypothetical protein